jgi:serine/threonine protein phosphatase PrpC
LQAPRYNEPVIPADLPVIMDVAAASDVGLVRPQNEDVIWFADHIVRDTSEEQRYRMTERQRGLMVAVADGVGGAAAGEVASAFVARRMAALYLRSEEGEAESLIESLKLIARQVQGELMIEATSNPEYRGMATTYTGVVFSPLGQCWIHAGDSRLYGVHRGEVRQISRDHTLREISGDMSIPGNIIVNCFGCSASFYADAGTLHPATADLYMVCSDGLSDYAPVPQMEAELLQCAASPEEALSYSVGRLVDLAKAGGGADNISLALIRPRYA